MKTKKQHYVPRLHLRRFANSDGKVAVYDKQTGKTFFAGVDDIGHENHFLTIESLDGPDGAGSFFESFFQGAEGAAAPAIARVLAAIANGMTVVVDAHDKRALAPFLVLQFLRTTKARARAIESDDAMRRVLEEVRRENPNFSQPGWGLDEPPADAKTIHARTILNPMLLQEMTGVFLDHIWFVFANGTNDLLYTSDHPLAFDTHAPSDVRGAGPASYGAELSFALSPRHLLTMVERHWATDSLRPAVYREGTILAPMRPEAVLYQRSLQVGNSYRYLYSQAPDFDVAKSMCEDNPELRKQGRPSIVVNYAGREL